MAPKSSFRKRLVTILPYAAIPLFMVVVQVGAAALLVRGVRVGDAPVVLKGNRGAPNVTFEWNEETRESLWASYRRGWFNGLPFNGALADPKMLAFRLLEYQNGGAGINPEMYDKNEI